MTWLSVTTSIYTFTLISITRYVKINATTSIKHFQVCHAQLQRLLRGVLEVWANSYNPVYPILLAAGFLPGAALDVHLEQPKCLRLHLLLPALPLPPGLGPAPSIFFPAALA